MPFKLQYGRIEEKFHNLLNLNGIQPCETLYNFVKLICIYTFQKSLKRI